MEKKSNFPEFVKSTDPGKVRKGSEGFYHESGAHYEYNPCNTVKYNRCQILVKRRAMDFQETKQSLLEYFFGREPNISVQSSTPSPFKLATAVAERPKFLASEIWSFVHIKGQTTDTIHPSYNTNL